MADIKLHAVLHVFYMFFWMLGSGRRSLAKTLPTWLGNSMRNAGRLSSDDPDLAQKQPLIIRRRAFDHWRLA